MDKTYTFKLDEDLHKKLKEFCKYNGYTMSGFLNKIIMHSIENENK